MSTIPPTNTHARPILAFLQDYCEAHDHAPTYREIMAAVGLTSKDHVARDLRHLQASGYIKIVPHTPKGIVLLGKSAALTVTAKPKRRKYPHGFCGECGIRCQTELCADCEGHTPFIQYHELFGADRYYLNASLFRGAPAPDDTPKRRYSKHQTVKECEDETPAPKPRSYLKMGRHPRLNAQGQRKCAKCENPRAGTQGYCRQHVNEYRMASYRRKRAGRAAAREHEIAHRINEKYVLP